MADGHFFLDINVCEEGTFIINAKGKDAVLIRKLEACTEDGAVGRLGNWLKIEAVKGR